MKNIKIEEYKYDEDSKFVDDYYVLGKCLEIANSDQIVTSLNEIMPIIFSNKNKKIIKDDYEDIIAYCVYDLINIRNIDILHIYDLRVHKNEQNKGIGKRIILSLIDEYNPSLLASKTNNPRAYKILSNILGSQTISYSNYKDIPNNINEVIKEDDYFTCDSNMIFENNKEEKYRQFVYDLDIREMFKNIPNTSSKGIIVVNNKKLNKIKKLELKKGE